ncbi:hypothetical protein PVK06_016968 [Gossypium arboreum]|uniref:Uncharacterized protein n=1 Tax=Gossypium arboreum TaxID=29729 RepID=A0ABR0Q1H5_GOSAR|nr:hypothetical protein PVK06_016968 [Gossypium arboreum]
MLVFLGLVVILFLYYALLYSFWCVLDINFGLVFVVVGWFLLICSFVSTFFCLWTMLSFVPWHLYTYAWLKMPGVTAGKAAGMEVVAVPSVPKQVHLYASADEVINSLLDLQPEK